MGLSAARNSPLSSPSQPPCVCVCVCVCSVLSRVFMNGATLFGLHDAPLGYSYKYSMHHLDTHINTVCTTWIRI